MQIVKWGKKQRAVKVPVGWAFVKDHKVIKERDKVFNRLTHAWDDIEPDFVGLVIGEDLEDPIVIRDEHRAYSGELDNKSRAERIVPEC